MPFFKVGIYPSIPVAFKDPNDSNRIKGIGVDIWEKIAKEIGIEYEYHYLDKTKYDDAIQMVSNGQLQLLIGNVFSRSERYSEVNFSRPYLNDTIQALMRASDFYRKILVTVIKTVLVIFGFLVAVTLVNLVLVAIDLPRNDWTFYNWIETSYKTAFVFATGDISITPNTVAGKILVLSYAILGVIFVGIIAANFVNVFITTANYITTVNDARKYKYVVRDGTIGDVIARREGLSVYPSNESYKSIIQKIVNGEIPKDEAQGIIGNRLSMIYAQSQTGDNTLGLAPYVFASLDFSFAINDNVSKSNVKDINEQIERLREETEIAMIANRYVPGFL